MPSERIPPAGEPSESEPKGGGIGLFQLLGFGLLLLFVAILLVVIVRSLIAYL